MLLNQKRDLPTSLPFNKMAEKKPREVFHPKLEGKMSLVEAVLLLGKGAVAMLVPEDVRSVKACMKMYLCIHSITFVDLLCARQ